jgi:hypothetical protein
MIEPMSNPRRNIILGLIKPGWLRWFGPWPPRMTLGRQDIKREMYPLKIRWGWVLLLAIAMVLAMGEWGTVASAIVAVP